MHVHPSRSADDSSAHHRTQYPIGCVVSVGCGIIPDVPIDALDMSVRRCNFRILKMYFGRI